jgi:hypothetical protein
VRLELTLGGWLTLNPTKDVIINGGLSFTYSTPAFQIAVLYAELGDKDYAFEWLETAYHERDEYLIRLRTDYRMDGIPTDPRYSDLVQKIGFPK